MIVVGQPIVPRGVTVGAFGALRVTFDLALGDERLPRVVQLLGNLEITATLTTPGPTGEQTFSVGAPKKASDGDWDVLRAENKRLQVALGEKERELAQLRGGLDFANRERKALNDRLAEVTRVLTRPIPISDQPLHVDDPEVAV